jgi:hypothetical protein
MSESDSVETALCNPATPTWHANRFGLLEVDGELHLVAMDLRTIVGRLSFPRLLGEWLRDALGACLEQTPKARL